jgi:hypothetical protein
MHGEPSWNALPVRPGVATPSPAERAAAVARHVAWARDRGAQFEGLDIGVDAAGNSAVRARRPLRAEEAIITIPRALILTDADFDASATIGEPHDTLAVWLALEIERADSPWRPLLETFPTQLPGLPMFRGLDDLTVLAGTAALMWMAETHGEIVAWHQQLPDAVRARVSLAAYAWACAIVSSRGFHTPHMKGPHLAFIPIVDLMDHRWDESAWQFDHVKNQYVVHALRDFAVGEPVHFTYGPFGNAHLLVEYGFALPDNRFDETVLEIGDELFLVTAQDDTRWNDVRARLDDAGIVVAARHALDRLDESDVVAAAAATAVSSDWRTTCELVRRGERRVLEHIVATRQRG